jgi:hypothetical protein
VAAPGKVFVVSPDGESGYLPSADVDGALGAGFRVGTPEEIAAHENEKKYGTTSQALMAGTEAAGRAMTLGLSTPAQVALGADPKAIKAREEVNPTAAMVGTGVGIAAPLLLTMGASAPAAAAEVGAMGLAKTAASLSAPALISRAGQAVTAGAKALLPEATTLGGQMLAKGAAVAAGGAVEGAAYGVGNVVHEAALGDPNLTAQSAIAEIGLNAALGGGFGMLAGVAEVGAPVAIGKAREAISGLFRKGKQGVEGVAVRAAEAAGTAPDVATLIIEHRAEVSLLEKQMPGITQEMTNATPEMAQWVLKNGSKLKELETAFPGTTKLLARTSPETADFLAANVSKIHTDPKALQRATGELREGMQSVLDKTDDVLRSINIDLAPREAEVLLATADGAAVKTGYESALSKMDEAIAAMRAEPELHSSAMARHMEKVREGLIRDAGDRLEPLAAFNRLKTLRQSLDEAIPYGKDAMALGFSDRNSVALLKEVRRTVKRTLTDESVFGVAGARRAALDEAQAEWLQLVGKGGAFRKAFMDSAGQIPSTKVTTWLNSLANDKGVSRAEAWGQVVAASKKVINEAEASAKSAPLSKFNRSAVDELVGRAEKLAAEQQLAGEAAATMKYLKSGGVGIPNSGPVGMGETAALAAAGMVLPGAVTSAVKATLNVGRTVKSVPRMVAILSALDSAGQTISRAIDTGAGVLVRGSPKAARIGRSEVAAGIANSFGNTPEQARATFLRRADKITQAAQPDALNERLTKQTEGLQEHAPNVAQALQVSSARGMAFLQAKMPKPPNIGPLAAKWVPSQTEIGKFNRYYEAVQSPVSILKQAAAGTLTPEAVEAVQTVYPDLFKKIQESALDKLTSHRGPVPYKSRLMLSLLLGTDLDGSLKPEVILRNQAAIKGPSARASQSTPGGAPPAQAASKLTIANRSLTPMQQAQARGDQ